MGSLRGIRKEAAIKDIPPDLIGVIKDSGLYRVVSKVSMETKRDWEQGLYVFSLKNLGKTFRKHYGEDLEALPVGVTYTLTFKENSIGQLRLSVEPDNVAEKSTKKVKDNFFASPEDLKQPSTEPSQTVAPQPITGYET